jgi:hypothetical protein
MAMVSIFMVGAGCWLVKLRNGLEFTFITVLLNKTALLLAIYVYFYQVPFKNKNLRA